MTLTAAPPQIQLTWADPTAQQASESVETLPVTIGRDGSLNTIGLESRFISDQHARIEIQDHRVMVVDLGSKNGVYIDGRRVEGTAALPPGGTIQIGPFVFSLSLIDAEAEVGTRTHYPVAVPTSPPSNPEDTSLTFDALTDQLVPQLTKQRNSSLPALFREQVLPIHELAQIAPVDTTVYLSIGGGLGSFAWVDHLVIAGANPDHIRVIGLNEKPYDRFRRLTRNSQMPDHERIRSNSDSCPDNIWGWPSYGAREMWMDFWHGRFGKVAKIGWQLFNEPFVETYTPLTQHVFDSIDREIGRIGWDAMHHQGRVRAIRKTDDGRYAILYSCTDERDVSQQRIMVCQYLHMAIGYPGVRFLPDLQAYRQQTGDFRQVVNAYEQHDYIYDDLKRNGGTVLIRGRGIVASRVIQRIYELRKETDATISILHLMRKPLTEPNSYKKAKRYIINHWEFQPFNWPKAAWGGDLRLDLFRADGSGRADILDAWSGTTTADRSDWQQITEDGLREGWYEILFGEVQEVTPHNGGRIATVIAGTGAVSRDVTLLADVIIDATGLESDIQSSPLLNDLTNHYGLPPNSQGRLSVSKSFELAEFGNGEGQAYATGINTLGGPYAPVDSFLGLQYAASHSIKDLTKRRAPGLRRLGILRSTAQWLRWALGVKPS